MADEFIDGVVKRRVSDLKPGDRVDLQNDLVADVEGYLDGGVSYACRSHGWEFEFAEVMEVEDEGADCVCVTFVDGFTCGFPPDHLVEVDGEQVRNEK